MSIFNRSFTKREKALILVLCLILLGFIYYYFVDQYVRTAINTAKSEEDSMQVEITAAIQKLQTLENMQKELDNLEGSVDQMPSYNAIKEEMTLLNDIMKGAENYTLTFSDVTRNGNQIRRDFSLQFRASSYEKAEEMLQAISDSQYRCKLNAVSCYSDSSSSQPIGYYKDGKYVITNDYNIADYNNINKGSVSVSCTATFYETMVGGKEDSGLPEPETVAETVAEE